MAVGNTLAYYNKATIKAVEVLKYWPPKVLGKLPIIQLSFGSNVV